MDLRSVDHVMGGQSSKRHGRLVEEDAVSLEADLGKRIRPRVSTGRERKPELRAREAALSARKAQPPLERCRVLWRHFVARAPLPECPVASHRTTASMTAGVVVTPRNVKESIRQRSLTLRTARRASSLIRKESSGICTVQKRPEGGMPP
jgi:hypothetical protein